MGDEGRELLADAPVNSRLGRECGAQSGALDGDLASLVNAWPRLPDNVRKDILAIVKSNISASGATDATKV